MNLLFSIDNHYFKQLLTTLLSIHVNTDADQIIDVYVIFDDQFSYEKELAKAIAFLKMNFHPIRIKKEAFSDAPTTDRYPTTVYYRLIAYKYLPEDLNRILYLDADILCINDLKRLYNIDLKGYMYASAIHTNLTGVTEVINKIRLQNFDSAGYFNSGVLLMNLHEIRKRTKPSEIYDFMQKHILLLPDQDVLNGLYGKYTKPVPDQLYNFDTRNLRIYETISFLEWNLDWVMKNTVLLHYCGRDKPWLASTERGKFTALYKNYFQITNRLLNRHLSNKAKKRSKING